MYRKERINGVEIAYYQEPILANLWQDQQGYPERMGFYSFSKGGLVTDEVMFCTGLVLTSQDEWGLYHGYFHTREALKQDDPYETETPTLEDFLEDWLSTDRKAAQAFLFGCAYIDAEGNVSEQRGNARRLVAQTLKLPPDRITSRWNNLFNTNIDIVVFPTLSQIRINTYTENAI